MKKRLGDAVSAFALLAAFPLLVMYSVAGWYVASSFAIKISNNVVHIYCKVCE